MGKAKKGKFGRDDGGQGERNAPLVNQILEDPTVRAPGRTKVRKRTEEEEQVSGNELSPSIYFSQW